MHLTASDSPPDDPALLREYAEAGSEHAFAELVRRHLPHVYASALRRVNGDRALAADVAQMVFADFARKAPTLENIAVPGGWLQRHTGFVAGKLIGKERRRRRLEQDAAEMNTLTESEGDPAWTATAPLLDAAMDALPRPDREALMLRFFEKRDFHAVGAALGVSDDTAQKRVSRALEKLRAALTRRGLKGTATAALPFLLLNFATPPAPAALAAAVPGKALALAAARPAGWLASLLGGSGWRRTTAGFAAAAIAASVPLVLQSRRLAEARNAAATPAPPSAQTDPGPTRNRRAAEPAPPPAPDVSDLIAQAAAAFRGGAQNVSAVSAALGFLVKVGPARMPEALTQIGRISDEAARALLYKYLLSFWAESDPQAALDFARNQVPEAQRALVCEGVLTAWAARNPESMMGWNQKTSAVAAPPVQESLMATVYKSLASQNPARAFEWLQQTGSANARAQALRGMMETVTTDADRDRMLGLIGTCQDEEIRVQARRAVVEHWALHDPAAAAAWVESAEPAWERTRLMDSLGFAWLQKDPAAAAHWWLDHAPGPDTLVKIINVWAQENPNDAGAWLSQQPPGAGSDTARMTFARQVADLDPVSALRWAETVTDAPLRESTLDHIWQTWHSRDATEAAQFLETATWPADRLSRLHARQ